VGRACDAIVSYNLSACLPGERKTGDARNKKSA
jgi:hypothetical protein